MHGANGAGAVFRLPPPPPPLPAARGAAPHLLTLPAAPCPDVSSTLQKKELSKKAKRIIEKKQKKKEKKAQAAAGVKSPTAAAPPAAPAKPLDPDAAEKKREKRERRKEKAQRRKAAAALKEAELKVGASTTCRAACHLVGLGIDEGATAVLPALCVPACHCILPPCTSPYLYAGFFSAADAPFPSGRGAREAGSRWAPQSNPSGVITAAPTLLG